MMETIYGPGGGEWPSYPTLHSKWNLEHPSFKSKFGFHRRKQKYILFLPELRHIEADFKISKWILEHLLYAFIYLSRSHRILTRFRFPESWGWELSNGDKITKIRYDQIGQPTVGKSATILLWKNFGWYVSERGGGRGVVEITSHRLHRYSEK